MAQRPDLWDCLDWVLLECVTDEKIAMQYWSYQTNVCEWNNNDAVQTLYFCKYALVVESVYFSILVRCVCVIFWWWMKKG